MYGGGNKQNPPRYGLDVRLLFVGQSLRLEPTKEAMACLGGMKRDFNIKLFGPRGLIEMRITDVPEIYPDVVWCGDIKDWKQKLFLYDIRFFYTDDQHLLSSLRQKTKFWSGWVNFLRDVRG